MNSGVKIDNRPRFLSAQASTWIVIGLVVSTISLKFEPPLHSHPIDLN
jgi:hypothetical protein